ncbi:MAG: phosphatidate cytidylyltransferase [Pseudomonadota bacterium]
MLKQRIITAIVLVIIVLAALFAEDDIYWRLMISAVVLVSFWEWLRFCEIDNLASKIVSYILFVWLLYPLHLGAYGVPVVVLAACVLWVALFLFTLRDHFQFFHEPLVKLVIGIVLLNVIGWLVVEYKSIEHGILWLLAFLLTSIAADVGAYFVGRKYGKTALAPKVSPGKTVEGMLGGLALVLVVFAPIYFFLFDTRSALALLLVAMITAVVSVGGDLFESKMKRHVGLKDSSNILPGHGGILDRIDSMLAAAPFFAAGLILLGYWK